jgi:hypothetical protein
MKNLLVLLFMMAFGTITGYTQDVPEKANTVIVKVSDSITIREKIVSLLESKGYSVNSAKTAKVITTAPRTLKNGTRVVYSFNVKGPEVFVTGSLPVAGQPGTQIAYKGNKGTPMMNGWEEMTKIAKELKGTIKYEVK